MNDEPEECMRCDALFPAGSNAVTLGREGWEDATTCTDQAACDKTLLTRVYATLDRLRERMLAEPTLSRETVFELATAATDEVLELLDGDWEPLSRPRCGWCFAVLPAGSDSEVCEFCSGPRTSTLPLERMGGTHEDAGRPGDTQ